MEQKPRTEKQIIEEFEDKGLTLGDVERGTCSNLCTTCKTLSWFSGNWGDESIPFTWTCPHCGQDIAYPTHVRARLRKMKKILMKEIERLLINI